MCYMSVTCYSHSLYTWLLWTALYPQTKISCGPPSLFIQSYTTRCFTRTRIKLVTVHHITTQCSLGSRGDPDPHKFVPSGFLLVSLPLDNVASFSHKNKATENFIPWSILSFFSVNRWIGFRFLKAYTHSHTHTLFYKRILIFGCGLCSYMYKGGKNAARPDFCFQHMLLDSCFSKNLKREAILFQK